MIDIKDKNQVLESVSSAQEQQELAEISESESVSSVQGQHNAKSNVKDKKDKKDKNQVLESVSKEDLGSESYILRYKHNAKLTVKIINKITDEVKFYSFLPNTEIVCDDNCVTKIFGKVEKKIVQQNITSLDGSTVTGQLLVSFSVEETLTLREYITTYYTKYFDIIDKTDVELKTLF